MSELRSLLMGRWQSAIWNRERNEFNPAGTAELGFTLQPELGNLIPLQKAYHQIDAGGLPLLDLCL